MQAPKILPWVARKAGITEGDALDAWQHALAEAAVQAGARSGAAFHRVAVDRFVALAHARAAALAARATRPASSTIRPASSMARRSPRPGAQLCAA